MSRATRIVLVDDHQLFREGLRALLLHEDDIEIVGEACDGFEALKVAKREQADLVIMDVSLKCDDGIEAMKRFKREMENVQVVILSMHDDAYTIDRALRSGARGYVVKGSGKETLCQAIHTIRRGQVFLAPDVSECVLQGYLRADHQHEEPLSKRELEVLKLIAEGYTSRESAKRLGLKPKTVENHRARIMDKLAIRTTAGLVRYALRIRLID
jgi:DNA-binding NarL/FixJ family response regulator